MIRNRISESLEHLARGETLAALGAFDGLEGQLAFASNALHLTARLYPTTSESQNQRPLQF